VDNGSQAPPNRPRVRDRPDYTDYCGGWEIGRIYQTRGGPDNLRWFWSMNANGPITRSNRVASLKEAKAQFQKSWEEWEGVGEAGRGAVVSAIRLTKAQQRMRASKRPRSGTGPVVLFLRVAGFDFRYWPGLSPSTSAQRF
jgi:hypothetical protein